MGEKRRSRGRRAADERKMAVLSRAADERKMAVLGREQQLLQRLVPRRRTTTNSPSTKLRAPTRLQYDHHPTTAGHSTGAPLHHLHLDHLDHHHHHHHNNNNNKPTTTANLCSLLIWVAVNLAATNLAANLAATNLAANLCAASNLCPLLTSWNTGSGYWIWLLDLATGSGYWNTGSGYWPSWNLSFCSTPMSSTSMALMWGTSVPYRVIAHSIEYLTRLPDAKFLDVALTMTRYAFRI